MSKRLFYLKLAHTAVWFFYVVVIFYILYAGIYNKIGIYLWIAISLVVFEGLILLIFKGKCPFTILGYKYTNDFEVGFDIYLPRWLAKHNKIIFGTIFGMGILLTVYRILT